MSDYERTRALRANNARLRRWLERPLVKASCDTGGLCSCGPMSPLCGHNTTFKGR